jgi:hypothetical protein
VERVALEDGGNRRGRCTWPGRIAPSGRNLRRQSRCNTPRVQNGSIAPYKCSFLLRATRADLLSVHHVLYRCHVFRREGTMESGDFLNYTMAASIIGAKLWKPVLAAAAIWWAKGLYGRAKSKKQKVSEKVSTGFEAIRGTAAEVVPATRRVIVGSAAPLAQVPGALKSVTQKGFEAGSVAVSKAVPVVQNAASAAFDVASAGLAKAAPVAIDVAGRAAVGAQKAVDLAAEKSPLVRDKAARVFEALSSRIKK